jgi:excisionase family DNA binding protein
MAEQLRTPQEAAARLRCSQRTLRAHVRAGALRYVIIGRGTKRPRRGFTDADLDEFIERQTRRDAPCLSTGRRARPCERLSEPA